MDEKEQKELAARLKSKRYRKYILTALAVFICVSAVVGISIEGKDAKLPDGQGNIVTGQQEDMHSDADSVPDSDTEKSEDIDSITGKGADSSTAGSEAKKEAEKQAEELSQLTDEEKEKIDPSDVKVDNSEDFTASNGGNAALRPKEPKPVTVTLEIRCDTLSSDMSKLENPALEDYIPEDGTILAKSTYKGTTDNTVFDALNTLCRNNDIQLEFSYTPIYESYYIEGINYLYEFDGGNLSGWMYKVNGWFPNYGCSSYYLSDGDVIEWVYTCDLGKDVGDNSMA
ncbi:MAG: DUF4430 domain-containing protein [Anaerovoracaceae bacterium]